MCCQHSVGLSDTQPWTLLYDWLARIVSMIRRLKTWPFTSSKSLYTIETLYRSNPPRSLLLHWHWRDISSVDLNHDPTSLLLVSATLPLWNCHRRYMILPRSCRGSTIRPDIPLSPGSCPRSSQEELLWWWSRLEWWLLLMTSHHRRSSSNRAMGISHPVPPHKSLKYRRSYNTVCTLLLSLQRKRCLVSLQRLLVPKTNLHRQPLLPTPLLNPINLTMVNFRHQHRNGRFRTWNMLRPALLDHFRSCHRILNSDTLYHKDPQV